MAQRSHDRGACDRSASHRCAPWFEHGDEIREAREWIVLEARPQIESAECELEPAQEDDAQQDAEGETQQA